MAIFISFPPNGADYPQSAMSEALAMHLSLRRHMRLGKQRAESALWGNRIYLTLKFTSEWIFSLVLLLSSLPLLIGVAILVKLTSVGPVFYCQLRLGKNGRVYKVFKIRTMLHECEGTAGAVWAVQDDPRVTPVGRFLRETHLDEIPQLWNVLRGEMSLIGPRPERPEIATELEKILPAYRQRLEVRPGMTGLAQLRLPADSDENGVRRKLSHDLYYIRQRGFLLDLQLTISTLPYLVARFSKLLSELLIRSHGQRADRQRKQGARRPRIINEGGKLELRIMEVETGRGLHEAMDGAKAA
jgi:lipopolysaccharide/colanic/teichoic acid biosynthesis glycosyltransferase